MLRDHSDLRISTAKQDLSTKKMQVQAVFPLLGGGSDCANAEKAVAEVASMISVIGVRCTVGLVAPLKKNQKLELIQFSEISFKFEIFIYRHHANNT
jgi:hypothetical protein